MHLVGHSNGPIYAQYLLTHTSRAWRHRYIHGFTPLAGNFPGQGVLYPVLFTGLNIQDFSFPADDRERRQQRAHVPEPARDLHERGRPAHLRAPRGRRARRVHGRSYTPRDYRRLLTDAGLRWAKPIADHYIGFVKFADRAHFPHVDVYAEKGSGIPTIVGAPLPNLSRRTGPRPDDHARSSRGPATSTRRTSRTTPCGCGGRWRASASASPTTRASITSRCRPIPACSPGSWRPWRGRARTANGPAGRPTAEATRRRPPVSRTRQVAGRAR